MSPNWQRYSIKKKVAVYALWSKPLGEIFKALFGRSELRIPDLIPCSPAGRTVPVGNVKALRSAICELLRDPVGLSEMSSHCGRMAVEKFNLELQTKRCAELYHSLLYGTQESAHKDWTGNTHDSL